MAQKTQKKSMAELQENKLFLKYRKTKNPTLRNLIINRYLYIAETNAKRFTGKGIEYDDLFQVACLGLLYAVERFDPDVGVKFTTFATPTVVGEIKRYFRDKGNFIKIPRRLYEVFARADRIRRANDSDIPKPQMPSVVSLDQELASESDLRMENLLGSDDEGYLMIEEKDFVERCMRRLTKKEREFVNKRYYEEKTQREIAKEMGMSQMYVSRLARKVLKKIKDMYLESAK